MKIPIEADKIRISNGELGLEEICFSSAADLARAAFGRTLSILTKRLYRLGSHHRLMDEDGRGLVVLSQGIHVLSWSAFHSVTFSGTLSPEE
jgi:hypothetical protein